MSISGKSYAGGFAVAEETTFGVPNGTPDTWIPVTQESIQTNRPAVARGGVYNSRERQCQSAGLETNAGNFSLEADGEALGLPFKWLIGDVDTAAFGGTISAAATVTGGTAGALADGSYQYRVANYFTRASDGAVHIGAASPASTAVNLSGGGTGSAALTWVNSTAPAGYALTGSMLYRKLDSGDFGHVHTQTGTGTSASDLGAWTDGTGVAPPEQLYQHTFIPPDVNESSDIPSFTITKLLDTSHSQQIDGCKISQMSVNVAEDGNSPVEFTFDVLGRRALKVANLLPSFTPTCAMLSWQSRVSIDGLISNVAKAMSLTVNQNLASQRALNGSPFVRDHSPGMLEVSGQLTLGFENWEQWDRLKAGSKFDLVNRVEGAASTDKAAVRLDANTLATPFPFGAEFHMPSCLYDGGAGGQLSGGDIMNEQPGYQASFSATAGYSIRIRLWNRTPSL